MKKRLHLLFLTSFLLLSACADYDPDADDSVQTRNVGELFSTNGVGKIDADQALGIWAGFIDGHEIRFRIQENVMVYGKICGDYEGQRLQVFVVVPIQFTTGAMRFFVTENVTDSSSKNEESCSISFQKDQLISFEDHSMLSESQKIIYFEEDKPFVVGKVSD